jgi:hypothetical protein
METAVTHQMLTSPDAPLPSLLPPPARVRSRAATRRVLWVGGPWSGCGNLDDLVADPVAREIVSSWMLRPPQVLDLAVGRYVLRGRTRDGSGWRYTWKASTVIRD